VCVFEYIVTKMTVQAFEDRSDVRKECIRSFPKVPYNKKGAEISQRVLDHLHWCTKQPIERAYIVTEESERPLTDEEANAPYFPYVPRGDGLDGTYIIVHPHAVSL